MNREQRRAELKNAARKNRINPGIKSAASQMNEQEQMVFLHQTFLLVKQGKIPEAIERCRDFSTKVVFGEVAMDLGRVWVGIDHENDAAWTYYGLTCSNSGKPEAAVKSLEKALELNPDNIDAMHCMTNALMNAGEFKKALHYSDEIVLNRKANHPMILEARGRLLWAMGYRDEAQVVGEAIYKQFPDKTVSNYFLGTMHLGLGNAEKAKKYFLKCCELEPGIPGYWYNLGLVYDQLGRTDKARQVMQKALEIFDKTDISRLSNAKARSTIASFLDTQRKDYSTYEIASFDTVDETLPYVQSVRRISDYQEMIEMNDTVTPANEWMFLHGDKAYIDMLMTNDDKILLGSQDSHKRLVLGNDFPHHYYDEPCIVLGGALNYYHWLCDYLPRMAIVDACPDLKELPIIVHYELSSFHVESLQALGYDPSRFVCVPRKHYLHFKKAFVPHIKFRPLSENGKFDFFYPALTPETVRYIRQRFSRFMAPRPDFPKRIFLSRKNAKFRRCENEDAVFEVAERYGFEKVRNEELSLTDQIALYAGADIVMGAHGAGFTNMLFAPEGATLIELFPMQIDARFFQNICGILNQRNIVIAGPRTNSLGLSAREFWDFEVDIAQVEQTLKSLDKPT